jgi:hypothetical protein
MSMRMITKFMKSLQNQIGKKVQISKTFSNHKGSLMMGERVTLISLNEQNQEVRISDPFGVEWVVPSEFVTTYI